MTLTDKNKESRLPKSHTQSSSLSTQSFPRPSAVSFLPIPVLIAAIAVFRSAVRSPAFYDPGWLILITNTLFVTVICFAVAFIAMRNYRWTGRIQILLLGCGVLIFGIGGVIAGLVRGLPDGANLNVTIYNIGAFVGAFFHFIAALILISGISPEIGSKQKGTWLAAGYLGVIIFMAAITLASGRGMIPPFFIQGQGPTSLRQGILGAADVLFFFSFLVFLAMYVRNKEVFLYWYSLALALTSISLTAFFIEFAVGDSISWTGRTAQYLGGVYFLIAIKAAIRSAEARKTSFDSIITASLSPAEEKFSALAENSPDVICRFDRELKHMYVNRAGLRLHGKPAASLIGKTLKEIGFPEPSCSLWEKRVRKVFETSQSMEAEDYFPTADGLRFYQSRCVPEFGPDGSVANVLVVAHDLTERKQAESVLQEAHDRTRAVLESIADGFFSMDQNWNLTYINRRAASLWKRNPAELLGKSLWEVVPAAVGTIFDEQYHKAVSAQMPVSFEAVSPIMSTWVEVRAYPSKDGLSVYFSDLTERKKAEAEIVKLSEHMAARNLELENANKELEAFIYSVSHDLRAPLRTIAGFSKILAEDYMDRLDDQCVDYLARINNASEKMTRLIEDLLRLSRISRQEIDRLDCDLGAIASTVVRALREADPARNVDVTVSQGLRAVVDPNLMKIALSNLLENAWKFTSKTPHARIEFGVMSQEFGDQSKKTPGSQLLTPDSQLVYYVRDNGAGFDQQYADRMFWPFHRLHSEKEFEGTGIGLAIVERIIRRHGGKVWAEGEVGKGAVFYFTL